MDRLRKEGSMLVEEEIQKVMKKMKTETTSYNTSSFILKVRWKVAKGDITNGGYCEENLLKLLSGVSFILENDITKPFKSYINYTTGFCITNINYKMNNYN